MLKFSSMVVKSQGDCKIQKHIGYNPERTDKERSNCVHFVAQSTAWAQDGWPSASTLWVAFSEIDSLFILSVLVSATITCFAKTKQKIPGKKRQAWFHHTGEVFSVSSLSMNILSHAHKQQIKPSFKDHKCCIWWRTHTWPSCFCRFPLFAAALRDVVIKG